MQHKTIKAQIRKQLKTRYPNWDRLSRKAKKSIAKKVLEKVVIIILEIHRIGSLMTKAIVRNLVYPYVRLMFLRRMIF